MHYALVRDMWNRVKAAPQMLRLMCAVRANIEFISRIVKEFVLVSAG